GSEWRSKKGRPLRSGCFGPKPPRVLFPPFGKSSKHALLSSVPRSLNRRLPACETGLRPTYFARLCKSHLTIVKQCTDNRRSSASKHTNAAHASAINSVSTKSASCFSTDK